MVVPLDDLAPASFHLYLELEPEPDPFSIVMERFESKKFGCAGALPAWQGADDYFLHLELSIVVNCRIFVFLCSLEYRYRECRGTLA